METLASIVDYMIDNRGKNPPYFTEDGIQVVDAYTMGNMQYPQVINGTRFIDVKLFNSFIRCKTQKNDLLVTLVGDCGNTCLCAENQIIIQNLIGLRFKKNISQLYMYYYFKQNHIKQWIQNLNRGVAQPNVKVGDLMRMKLEIPNTFIQKKIASILNDYDQLIENNNRRIKILEDMAESLYKEWFVRFRFPGYKTAEFENGIPKGWEYKKFNEVFSYSRGISYSTEEIECDDGNNLINLKNISSFGGYRRDGLKKYDGKYKENQIVKYKDLVMGVTDMTQDRRTVGAVALIPNLTGVISADLVKLYSLNNISNIFSYCLFRYGFYSKLFSQFGNGANVIHLKPASIGNQKILIPDKNLIDLFVAKVEPLIDLIEYYNNTNDNLTMQRDALLPRLMSGKLEVSGGAN